MEPRLELTGVLTVPPTAGVGPTKTKDSKEQFSGFLLEQNIVKLAKYVEM